MTNKIVTCYVDGRFDFKRQVRKLKVDRKLVLIEYIDYPYLPSEWVPISWLSDFKYD